MIKRELFHTVWSGGHAEVDIYVAVEDAAELYTSAQRALAEDLGAGPREVTDFSMRYAEGLGVVYLEQATTVFEVRDGAIQTVAIYDNQEAAEAHVRERRYPGHSYDWVETVLLERSNR